MGTCMGRNFAPAFHSMKRRYFFLAIAIAMELFLLAVLISPASSDSVERMRSLSATGSVSSEIAQRDARRIYAIKLGALLALACNSWWLYCLLARREKHPTDRPS